MTFEKREYPFTSYQTNHLFKSDQDIDKWVLENDSIGIAHEYCATIKSESYIFTPAIQEYLFRYKMQTDYNIISYSNSFDEVPANYMQMLAHIGNELISAQQEKARLGKS